MPKGLQDKFDQYMTLGVTMSAANTLTFAEVAVGISLFDYAGFLLTRIEYTPGGASYHEVLTTADSMTVAVCGSNTITDLNVTRPEVYDRINVITIPNGTPASAWVQTLPEIHDFTGMQQGGILVPAQNVYIGMLSTGFVAAGTCTIRMWYRVLEMTPADYIELAQRLRVLST